MVKAAITEAERIKSLRVKCIQYILSAYKYTQNGIVSMCFQKFSYLTAILQFDIRLRNAPEHDTGQHRKVYGLPK